MTAVSSTRLGSTLKRTSLFSDSQIERLLEARKAGGSTITELVVTNGFAMEDQFLEALASTLNLKFARLAAPIEAAVLESLPTRVVFQYNVIPVTLEDNTLSVAANDPFNPEMVDALRIASGKRIRIALSTAADIARAAKKFYGIGADTVEKMMADDRIEVSVDETLLKSDLSAMDQEASIVKFVNQIIWEAYQERATDIHLEPMENELRIRYRVDSILHPTPLPPQLNRFQAAIISRIKVMANMDIAEKRLPQDGRIGLRIQGEDIDIRVSTMPTVYGESVSLRLLMKGKSLIGLSELGMYDADAELIRKLIKKPNGILLVTGPTGSGKSTSLYAYLQEINSVNCRILTIEDPIEYEMPGINQVQLREEIGLTFASALRTFLRQDPDIIMVGEIRDFDTAEIAIRASLTGHLVFSTLHTNDAAGAITRLIDMGVEPFLVASAVEAIVAQRLVRRLCESCRAPLPIDSPVIARQGLPSELLGSAHPFSSVGCEKCRTTGFRGRTGIYEILRMSEEIEPLVIARESTSAIREKALSEGMRTLRDDGMRKALEGITTIEEVLRVVEEAEG
ncbi:MAG: type II/IV secretion system protein [Lentisphaerales bacterium]|jgi:type II secretion system protein E|nr:MAG: type II/IV secretion system protein [Lentisphaerales bacterium]